ncbi:MAG: zf-HC2 domain-containing protein [Woeseia sp.]|jgi:anti-sigma factor RsiW|nr:zf-HC2 domain-containing protein [Woeseia sp.]MBT6209813.1 zf-HC2 domain-containing protein [Woeseia sp.]
MNCNQTPEQLDEYLDGALPTDDQVLFEAHLEQCAECRSVVEESQTLRSRLAQYGEMTMPIPDAGFYARALAKAAQSGLRKQRNRWVMTGFSGAIAATLMIWMVSSVFFAAPQMDQPTVPSVTMALEAPQTFNLVFSSSEALTDASMTVTLPAGIELDGFAGQREITWMTSLKEGRNILPLTLVATSSFGGELLATLQHADDNKIFRLQVSVI